MQWLVGGGVPQRARLRHPRLGQDCGLPRCPIPPGSSSASSSHQRRSSGWRDKNTQSGVDERVDDECGLINIKTQIYMSCHLLDFKSKFPGLTSKSHDKSF